VNEMSKLIITVLVIVLVLITFGPSYCDRIK